MHVPKVHKNKSLYKNVMYLGNSPYSYFHVGGLSTKGCHPQTMAGIQSILKQNVMTRA